MFAGADLLAPLGPVGAGTVMPSAWADRDPGAVTFPRTLHHGFDRGPVPFETLDFDGTNAT